MSARESMERSILTQWLAESHNCSKGKEMKVARKVEWKKRICLTMKWPPLVFPLQLQLHNTHQCTMRVLFSIHFCVDRPKFGWAWFEFYLRVCMCSATTSFYAKNPAYDFKFARRWISCARVENLLFVHKMAVIWIVRAIFCMRATRILRTVRDIEFCKVDGLVDNINLRVKVIDLGRDPWPRRFKKKLFFHDNQR